MFKMLHLL